MITGRNNMKITTTGSREVKVVRTRRGIIALVCTVVFGLLAYISGGAVSSIDKKTELDFIPKDLNAFGAEDYSNTSSVQEVLPSDSGISMSKNTMTSEVEKEDELAENKSSLLLGPDMDIFPRKLYNIIGLESSGTKYLTDIITKALGLPKYRNGSNADETVEAHDTQVVHYSLPWGHSCETHPTVHTVDVVLPSQCTRDNSNPDCSALAKEAWGFDTHGKVKYPPRWNLDIISNKEFYEKHNVEVFNIIVIRDSTISLKARKSARHCQNQIRAKQEEEAGTAIIVDAINKYILENDKDRLVTSETYPMWLVENFNTKGHVRRALSSTGLLSGQNVVLVSYESLMKLQQVYVELLYKTLGIESDYEPDFKDGNFKYIQD